MNLKTTFTLLLLAAAGGAFWFVLHQQQPEGRASETLEVLRTRITPDKVNRIEVVRGDGGLVLERAAGGAWSFPGAWPTRQHEVEELVNLITSGLQTRFAPIPLDGDPPDLKPYGLDPSQKPVKVIVRSGEQDYRLTFGEKPGADNRFSGPTMLRLNEDKEVLTLAPNLVALLSRPVDYYQQRRLFPAETVKDSDGSDRREQLAAQSVQVKGKDGAYTLQPERPAGAGAAVAWDLVEPVRDRADPDKLKTVLTAVPDIWADQFIYKPAKDLTAYGLSDPEQTITVTGKQGEKLVLLIGKESPHKGKRTVTRPAPPPAFPGQPPAQPMQETVPVVFRYAKLQNNDQIFEIQAEKLKDIFVAPDTLRDAQLARFRPEEAKRLEIHYAGEDIVLVKEKDKWKLQKPLEGEAEMAKITELLNKLSGFHAKDKDVLDKADLKSLDLSPPAGTVKVQAEETQGEGDKKTTKEKSFTFLLGKDDAEKAKLAVQMEGWPRVNLVEDAAVALLKRPALAYRSRRVLDFMPVELARVEVQRGGEKYVLEQDKANWRLVSPVKAEAEATKTERLAEDLGRLEAVEYVANAPKEDELEKAYGLGKPALSATFTFTKADKPAQTILIGKQRGDKPEYFAKLASDPGIFVVRKDTRDAVDKDSLAYRKLHPWQLDAVDVAEIRHRQNDQEYQLKREGLGWKIVEPFQATAAAKAIEPLVNGLANPEAERYETHEAKDLAKFGLDKPFLRLTVIPAEKKESRDRSQESGVTGQESGDKGQQADEAKKKDAGKPKAGEPAKPRVLLIGKPTAEGAKSRFAKTEDDPAVFVVGDKFLTGVERGALDLLDRKLLALDTASITEVKSSGQGQATTLKRDKETWQVEGPSAKFTADGDAVGAFLGVWSNLEAGKFAAYGPKVDWKTYGLDKPERTVMVTVAPAKAGDEQKPAKPEEHTVALGKEVPGEAGARYGRVDNGPGAVVFGAAVAAELGHTALDFADRTVLKLDPAKVVAVNRKGGSELALAKEKDAWQMVKPQNLAADGPTLENLLQDLSGLRARRVAAYAPKDLKPFGLDQPEAVVELRGAGDPAVLGELRIGKLVEGTTGDRFVQAAGAKTVGVLSEALAGRLLAAPLQFRDRNLARLTGVDRVMMERGPRRVVFAREDRTWKMTSPVEVEAEQTDLEAFLKALEHLRADQLVADKPADLKANGLDRPQVRWHLLAGGKEVLSLMVGAHEKVNGAGQEKEGPRLYAKLATGDVVFLLDPKLSEQALGEYRSRTVWGPLDAVQVDTVRYGYAKDPFTLEKKGDAWQAAGKPDVKIVSETVSETLDALARLKPERFVADKDPDLKLYGLEPPALVLEVMTPSGKRGLHVGRTEGGSKRYYAKVWEGNHNAVFVLSEEDSGLIVRDVNAFTKPPTKKPEPPGQRPGLPRRPGLPPAPPN
jgi:hypothetical protein